MYDSEFWPQIGLAFCLYCFPYNIPNFRNGELLENLRVLSKKTIIGVEGWPRKKAMKVYLILAKGIAVGAITCRLEGDSFTVEILCMKLIHAISLYT